MSLVVPIKSRWLAPWHVWMNLMWKSLVQRFCVSPTASPEDVGRLAFAAAGRFGDGVRSCSTSQGSHGICHVIVVYLCARDSVEAWSRGLKIAAATPGAQQSFQSRIPESSTARRTLAPCQHCCLCWCTPTTAMLTQQAVNAGWSGPTGAEERTKGSVGHHSCICHAMCRTATLTPRKRWWSLPRTSALWSKASRPAVSWLQ